MATSSVPSSSKRGIGEPSNLSMLVDSLQHKELDRSDILSLFDALPKSPSPRQSDGRGQSFAAGSYVHGGVVGLHATTKDYAGAVELICRFLQRHLSGVPFTSFIFLDQCQSSLHIDANNEPDSWNLIVPLTDFEGGQVWFQSSDGHIACPEDANLKGELLSFQEGPRWLSATKAKHCTLPWVGRRCVLISYCTRFSERLSASDVCTLVDRGFTLEKPCATGESFKAQPEPQLRLQDCIVLELCCGPAAVSKACNSLGFQTLALDRRPQRGPVRVVQCDFTQPDAAEGLIQMLSHDADRIAMVWARLPCSTTCRARSRSLPQLKHHGKRVPVPLRSDEFPDGVRDLTKVDKHRLETANLIFEAVCSVIETASRLSIRCVIENPADSLLWKTSWFRSVEVRSPKSCWVPFDLCAHGGDRPKPILLWCSSNFLSPIRGSCPGVSTEHRHASWAPVSKQGKFSVGFEPQAYPDLLCKRVAGLLRADVIKKGVCDAAGLPTAFQQHQAATNRMVLGLQPQKLPGILPEFGYFVHVVAEAATGATPQSLAPPGGAFISRHLSTWGEVQAEKRVASVGIQCRIADPTPSSVVEVFRFGIPLKPEKFVERAVSVGHPHSFSSNLEPTLKEVVRENIVGDEANLAKRRLKFVAKWSSRAKELNAKEQALHASLPGHVRQILKGKRLLLWQEMIDEYGLPDTGLIEDMKKGFPLSGWLPESHAFPKQVRRPEFSLDTLKLLSGGLNKATRDKMSLKQDPDLEAATWEETLAELQSGWIWQAPKVEDDFKVFARRFGISQNGKIRVIDDCSCCGLNATVGTVEKFIVHAIDRMASMLAYALGLSKDHCMSLCGRTYDLKAAYKQFPVACQDREFLRLFVNQPGVTDPTAVGLNALPFGAIGSVAAFLRVSTSVWMLGVVALRVIWTAFFDDYSVVTKTSLQKNVAFAVQSLFELLGLTYATEGKKAPDFAPAFNMLGLVVDLTGFKDKVIKIGHTPKRIQELVDSLDSVAAANLLCPKEAERLRGRMNFFEGYAFGRGPAQAVKLLDRQARAGLLRTSLTQEANQAIEILKERLVSAIPLEINLKSCNSWFLFTDGAFENGVGSVGAVYFGSDGIPLGSFGSKVPSSFMRQVLAYSSNPIYELELLPVLLALRAWGEVFRSGQLVCYVDNEAAKAALIKSCAATSVGERIVNAIRLAEDRLQVRCWYSRVPSKSNPADAPSRLCFDSVPRNSIVESSQLQWEVPSSAF